MFSEVPSWNYWIYFGKFGLKVSQDDAVSEIFSVVEFSQTYQPEWRSLENDLEKEMQISWESSGGMA